MRYVDENNKNNSVTYLKQSSSGFLSINGSADDHQKI